MMLLTSDSDLKTTPPTDKQPQLEDRHCQGVLYNKKYIWLTRQEEDDDLPLFCSTKIENNQILSFKVGLAKQ